MSVIMKNIDKVIKKPPLREWDGNNLKKIAKACHALPLYLNHKCQSYRVKTVGHPVFTMSFAQPVSSPNHLFNENEKLLRFFSTNCSG